MHFKIRVKAIPYLLLSIMLFIIMLPMSVSADENEVTGAEPFACWIVNGETRIDGIPAETDSKYYLKVPADVDASEITVFYTGTIENADVGSLDIAEKKVTGAFAAGTEVTLTGNGEAYTVVLETYPTDTRAFSCYTYDNNNNAINGYWSEKDSIWYLFVPSTVTISDITLSYTGPVTHASAGSLDMNGSVVTGAFSQSGDQLVLTTTDNQEYTIQVMQSDLPSVHIVLNGTTLSEVHKDKDKKYKKNSVYIMDPNGTYDLTVEDSVEMKGRGNTTWKMFDKKGYQIKFDSKTSVMGMGAAKKWVLLANAGDDSMMRTMLTYRMAKNLGMDYVTSFEYIDLWVSGEYLGTYILGEKVEPGSTRLNLQNDLGVLFEQDEAYYAEEDYWFFSETLQRHFVMKEIVEEEDAYITSAMTDFEESVDEFAEYLFFTPSEEATLADLDTMIDVDSFIKYYLVAEYVMNREAIASSFYWYKDGPDDVIHLGPLWDYDTCMGNDGPAYTESYAHNHLMFRYLLAIPEFYEKTMELKAQYDPYLKAMTGDTEVIKSVIDDSAAMNYLRWDVLGKPTNKDGSYFADTFDEAVSNVKAWLNGRESAFTVKREAVVYTALSSDAKKMEIYCDDNNVHSDVVFAVWGTADEQNDLRWYEAQRDEYGIWHTTIDLRNHNELGTYMISARSGDVTFGRGQSYVREISTETDLPEVNITVSEDCESMDISYVDTAEHTHVHFAVWSQENGQDDLRWYASTKNASGQWEYTVDLRNHNSAGIYSIHVYSITGSKYTKLAEQKITVQKATNNPVTVTIAESNESMTVTYEADEQHPHVRFAVWSDIGGQDDLEWYAASQNASSQWTYSVDLRTHNTTGKYNIHVYSITGGVYTKQFEETVIVEEIAKVPVTVTISENNESMTVTYETEEQHPHVRFAVWSDIGGQDDLEWYAPSQNASGQWTYSVDLRTHNTTGKYNIHVYSISGGVYTKQFEETVIAEEIAKVPVTVTISENNETMTVTYEAEEQYPHVRFAVWSEIGGQDDLEWYAASQNASGQWTYSVDLRAHNTAGKYNIHVYSINAGVYTKRFEASAVVEEAVELPVTVTVSESDKTMTVSYETDKDYTHVHFAVWTKEGGQDDLAWYASEETADGNWTYTIDLQDHGTTGSFNIHIYSITNKVYTKLIEHNINV